MQIVFHSLQNCPTLRCFDETLRDGSQVEQKPKQKDEQTPGALIFELFSDTLSTFIFQYGC